MVSNIRDREIGALKQMLNLNSATGKSNTHESVWKLLVYDRCGQDIISPLLSVKELRDMGITLHMLLHSDREPIPDVPAIYFVAPTDENVERICQDFRNQLYEKYYLNFISPITRKYLEDLATASIQANCVNSICKVFDQYLNFITLESDMFTLKHYDREKVSYYAINRGDVTETEMDAIVDAMVDCLFSTFATLGVVPIIRCARGNCAEMVATRLDKKLRDNIRDARNSLFLDTAQPGQLSFQRPLLVILDRNMDLATPLHHTWTYQALTHDVLDFKLNRVAVQTSPEATSADFGATKKAKTETFDLNVNDSFWQNHKASPFPAVAEAVQEELEAYKAREGDVKALKAQMGLDGDVGDEAFSMLTDNTARLTSAVSSLPELLEKKRLINQHMTVASAILDQIKGRKLDLFFETEERILGRQMLERSILDLIRDPETGTPEDKLRLFLIYFLFADDLSPDDLRQHEEALIGAGCSLSALKYLKRWKDFAKLTVSQYAGSGTKTVSMFTKLMSQGSQFVMEGVKNLVVKRHKLPVTRAVDALMELKSSPDTDDYRYFDPKLLRDVGSNPPKTLNPFQEAVVFMVGGGNYTEYHNLVDCMRQKSNPRRVVYGCSELTNANQFLKQLSRLGEEM